MLHMGDIQGYDAVAINSGVMHHTTVEKHSVSYGDHSFIPAFEDDAFLPKRNWRSLNKEEIGMLRPTGKRNDTNAIYIGDLPDSLKGMFDRLKIEECRSREEVLAKFRGSADMIAAINPELDTFLRSKSNGGAYQFHYLGTNWPNLEVVACDTTVMPVNHREEDKRYMGVHNDGTKYVPLHSLYQSGNRLSINLGKEPRYFLFINLTLTQALNMLKQKIDVKQHKIDIINISTWFFRYYPDYPVIRVEQKPYQFYIAPTDNCFHDGSTLGTRELDILMVYFGSFCY